eukprot:TRINITY_DN50_c0_g1_i5.p1 TRINITY_DN50_c0_g1~~TRINITY_DN50_c0_g1_i5.p1  ORF type:complete len:627 (+),score=210.93 TRINITY_DN50_c0_g1_i5:128-2008(+)
MAIRTIVCLFALCAVALAVDPRLVSKVERDMARLKADLGPGEESAPALDGSEDAALETGASASAEFKRDTVLCINTDRVKVGIFGRREPSSTSQVAARILKDTKLTSTGREVDDYVNVVFDGSEGRTQCWVAKDLVKDCKAKSSSSWWSAAANKVTNWVHETHDDNLDRTQTVSEPKSWWNRAKNYVTDKTQAATKWVQSAVDTHLTGANAEHARLIRQRYGSLARVFRRNEDSDMPASEIDENNPCKFYHGVKESVGSGGVNNAADVAMVKNRLNQLGFRAGSTSEMISSIKLFQTIIKGETKMAGDGRVDPGGATDSWLGAANAPGWMKFADFDGYYNYDIPQEAGKFSYGTTWTNDFFKWVAPQAKRIANVYRVTSNDVSLRYGGRNADHSTHESGLSIDMPIPKYPNDPTDGGYRKTVSSRSFDRTATRALLRVFKSYPHWRRTFLNDRTLINEGLCKYSSGHADHIHVDIKPPPPVACGRRVHQPRQPGGSATPVTRLPAPTQIAHPADATRVIRPVARPITTNLNLNNNNANTAANTRRVSGRLCNYGRGNCANPGLCRHGYWRNQCGTGRSVCCKPAPTTLPTGRPCNNNRGACAYRQFCTKGYWRGHCGTGAMYCCKP